LLGSEDLENWFVHQVEPAPANGVVEFSANPADGFTFFQAVSR
jgi:hypothetical protein